MCIKITFYLFIIYLFIFVLLKVLHIEANWIH